MKEVLKLCPFCGGDAKVSCNEAVPPDISDPFWIVSCPRENDCTVWPMATGDSLDEAVEAWNTRYE